MGALWGALIASVVALAEPAASTASSATRSSLPAVRVDPQPHDVAVLFASYAAEKGLTGRAAMPACTAMAEAIAMCFTVQQGTVRRMVTLQDLADWGETLAQLNIRAGGLAADIVAADPAPEAITVDGLSGRYFVYSDNGNGFAAGLLTPDKLEWTAGAKPVVAIPAKGTLLFWVPGDPQFDKVVAVGVRRMYESADHPISPLIYQYRRGGWHVWGETREAGSGGLP